MCSIIFFVWVELNSLIYDGRSLSVRGSASAGSGGNELATFCCKGRNGLGDSGVGERLHHERIKKKKPPEISSALRPHVGGKGAGRTVFSGPPFRERDNP